MSEISEYSKADYIIDITPIQNFYPNSTIIDIVGTRTGDNFWEELECSGDELTRQELLDKLHKLYEAGCTKVKFRIIKSSQVTVRSIWPLHELIIDNKSKDIKFIDVERAKVLQESLDFFTPYRNKLPSPRNIVLTNSNNIDDRHPRHQEFIEALEALIKSRRTILEILNIEE